MKQKPIIFVLLAIVIASFAIFALKKHNAPPAGTHTVEFLLDWKMTSFYAPYLLADEEGYYMAEGLSVKITEGQGAETTAKLVGQGTYQIGTCNAAATAIAIDNNVPVISIAMLEQDAVTDIFSLKKSNIRAPADLIGKTLGVRYYDISHKEYLAMMKAKGLDASKVKEVNVGWELQPLLTGQVDALYNYAYNMPVILKLQEQEVNEILVKDNGVKGYGSNLVANRGFAQSNGDVVKRFLHASRKAWEETMANPEKAVAVLKKRYPETDEKTALATLKEQIRWLGDSKNLFSQSDERWNEVLQTYRSLDMVKKKLPTSDVFTDQYLN